METKAKVPARSHKKKVLGIRIPPGMKLEPFPNPTGKPVTILYKKLPDNMILITGFENFLTADEIFKKYGEVVYKAYCVSSPTNMHKQFLNDGSEFVWLCLPESTDRIFINQSCSKKQFAWIISHLKKCGGLLHDIILAVNGGEVKRIQI